MSEFQDLATNNNYKINLEFVSKPHHVLQSKERAVEHISVQFVHYHLDIEHHIQELLMGGKQSGSGKTRRSYGISMSQITMTKVDKRKAVRANINVRLSVVIVQLTETLRAILICKSSLQAPRSNISVIFEKFLGTYEMCKFVRYSHLAERITFTTPFKQVEELPNDKAKITPIFNNNGIIDFV